MTLLRRRQKEDIIRQTLARVPVSGSSSGPASQLDANGTILDVNVITDGEVLKRVGTAIVSAPVGAPGAHATTHQPGGTDPMAVDAAAATGSLRTIGTGALQATAGNDARLTNARTPTAHAATHNAGGADAMAIDAVGAGSLRTLGVGANQATAGNDSRLSDARTPLAHVHPTSDVTSGRFVAARLLDGTNGFVLTGKGAGVDPAYGSLVTARLTADNAPIAAAVPTTVVTVAGLVQAALINEEWDIEWLLDIANSIAADVFVFNVTSSAGTLTGRYVVTGVNGVPGTGAGVAKVLQQPAGTITVASVNAPGNTGTIGLVTTVSVRFRGKLTVANANIQLGIRAGTSGALTSGTATVKIQSQMSATKIV